VADEAHRRQQAEDGRRCDLNQEEREAVGVAQKGLSVPPDDIGLRLSSTPDERRPWPVVHRARGLLANLAAGFVAPSTGSAPGTLNSLTCYCLDLANTCGFITDRNYPPPPG
jgi:hypothetical protein